MCRASIHRRDLPGGTRSDEERINIGEPAYTLRTDEGRLRELRRRQIIEREERQRALDRLVAERERIRRQVTPERSGLSIIRVRSASPPLLQPDSPLRLQTIQEEPEPIREDSPSPELAQLIREADIQINAIRAQLDNLDEINVHPI